VQRAGRANAHAYRDGDQHARTHVDGHAWAIAHGQQHAGTD